MLTHTALDLTPFGSLLQGVGFLIALAALAAIVGLIWLSVTRPKRPLSKAFFLSVIVLPIAVLIVDNLMERRALSELPTLFHELCYAESLERIAEPATAVRTVAFVPLRGPMGDFGFDLFYGTGRPKEWNGASVIDDAAERSGSVLVKYTYLPKSIKIHRSEVLIHGVRIEVFEGTANRLIAERVNFHWGSDLNRGLHCLGYGWFRDNEAFLSRVLGPQQPGNPWPLKGRAGQTFVKASVVRTEEVRVTLRDWYETDPEVLPSQSWDNGTVRLKYGSFSVPERPNGHPLPVVAHRRAGDVNLFVLLPNGWARDVPPAQIMFHFRKPSGEELCNLIAQIPPGASWTHGWGVQPTEFEFTRDHIEFTLYGDKDASDAKTSNRGVYSSAHRLRVATPSCIRDILTDEDVRDAPRPNRVPNAAGVANN